MTTTQARPIGAYRSIVQALNELLRAALSDAVEAKQSEEFDIQEVLDKLIPDFLESKPVDATEFVNAYCYIRGMDALHDIVRQGRDRVINSRPPRFVTDPAANAYLMSQERYEERLSLYFESITGNKYMNIMSMTKEELLDAAQRRRRQFVGQAIRLEAVELLAKNLEPGQMLCDRYTAKEAFSLIQTAKQSAVKKYGFSTADVEQSEGDTSNETE